MLAYMYHTYGSYWLGRSGSHLEFRRKNCRRAILMASFSQTTAQEKGEQKAPEWFMLHSPVMIPVGDWNRSKKGVGTGSIDVAIVGKWMDKHGIAWGMKMEVPQARWMVYL